MSNFSQTMYSSVKGTRTAVTFFSQHTFTLNVVTTILVLLCAIVYIVQVNGSVGNGYTIREYEDTINGLTLENQKLEVTAREARALENVTRSVKMLGLVSAETPTYVNAAAPSVALAR